MTQDDEDEAWNDNYERTVKFAVLLDIIDNKPTEEEIKQQLEEVRELEMPDLPSDGSKGQWTACKAYRIEALEFVLR